MKINDVKEGLKDPKDNPCWKGYKPVGTKKKAGRTVPNCVPKESVSESGSKYDSLSNDPNSEFYGLPDEAIEILMQMPPSIKVDPNAPPRDLLAPTRDTKWPQFAELMKQIDALKDQGKNYDAPLSQAMAIPGPVKITDWFRAYAETLPQNAQINDNPMTTKETRNSYYNPQDYERDQQRQMDYEKRDFKRREMEHELGHEDDPDFERKLRQQQMDRDRGPWYIRINGKIFKSKGEVKVFDWKKGANNYALAILKNRPELQGKIMLTKRAEDDTDMSESKKQTPPKPRNFVVKNAKMGGAGAHKDKKKAQKQGETKHKNAVYEAGELKVQKDDEKATILLNPATGVQTQIDKTNPNAPRLAQDETGKLKLSAPQGAGDTEQKPNLVGKDVSVDSAPVEDVHNVSSASSQPGDELTDINTRSAISGEEDHDEISKLLTQRLRKLAGL